VVFIKAKIESEQLQFTRYYCNGHRQRAINGMFPDLLASRANFFILRPAPAQEVKISVAWRTRR
jgi:hypothetical protein